jgi:hypothetical protein
MQIKTASLRIALMFWGSDCGINLFPTNLEMDCCFFKLSRT